jgi:predicted PurR-regulated permease PerM
MTAPSVSQRWQLLALVVLVGLLLYLLAPVLTPFAVAAMFAYLFDPVVGLLQRLRLSRGVAVGIVFVGLTVLLVLMLLALIPFLEHQVALLIGRLPDWIAWLQNDAVGWLNATFDLSLEMPDSQQLATIIQEHWKEAGGTAAIVVAKVSKSGLAIVAWITHLIVIPVAFFYLLRDWHELLGRIRELLPRSFEEATLRLARESDETLSGFVRGQLSVMLVLGVIYAVGLRAVGLDVGPLIGIISGLISFVPYLGAILGVLAGVVAALVQYHDWLHVVLVLVVFGVGHVLESYVLVPRLVGEKIGLHPLAVIFAILAGGELFGFLGVLLALPVASVVMVLLRYAHERYTESALYHAGHQPVIVMPGSDATTSVATASTPAAGDG